MTNYKLLILFLFFNLSLFSQKLISFELGSNRISFSEKEIVNKWKGLTKIETFKHTKELSYLVFYFKDYPPKTIVVKASTKKVSGRVSYTSKDGKANITLSQINGLLHVLVGLYYEKGDKPYHFSSHSLENVYGKNVKYNYEMGF